MSKTYDNNELKSILEDMFLDDYEGVNDTRILLNDFFKENNVDYEYSYDEFCKEMLEICYKYPVEVINMNIFPLLVNQLVVTKIPEERLNEFFDLPF